ncbi:putative salicylate 1-monooxygenase protein [Penicillium brasilianum]|uniref:Putative salicylate 1-monooxygenase protein n=1 Tax=Penicillium brasilianum TaxID=104259 RepID=A0A1S9RWT8_PENBI|nr:putative salicylate 1-monooxygenase protein [Penicillium brasilianum]
MHLDGIEKRLETSVPDCDPSIRTEMIDQTALERNKQLVKDFYRRVFDGQNASAVKDFVTEGYIQHGAHVPPGRAGLEGFVRMIFPDGPVPEPKEMRNPPTLMIAEGDMVVVSAYFPQPDAEHPGETYDYYVFDAFRIEDGKLAEHWSSINKVAPPIVHDSVPEISGKSTAMSQYKNIAIVGAGIGGLAAAVRLRREGFDVDIYEQASELRELGAAVGLRPRTVKILESWGLKDRYLPCTSRVGNIFSLDGRTGTPIGEIVIPSETDDPDENWSDIIHRADLHSLLSSEIPHERIHLSHKCIRVTDLGDHVELAFSDGTTTTAAAVVGADGIHSRIRPVIMQTEAVFSGLQGHRGTLPFEKVKDMLPENLPCNWLLMNPDGVLSLFIVLPYAGGEHIAFDAVLPAQEAVSESWRNTTTRDELIRRLAGFEPRVQEIVRRFDQDGVLAFSMYDRDPIPVWTKNRITLLGDAAHPMLPTEGQGANMAIQDAQILGDCLSGATTDQFPVALQDYAELRIPITREIQQKSRDKRPFDFEMPPHLTM